MLDKDAPDADAGRRAAIVTAATSIVRRFGAERTRVVDIARKLGVSHSALYRHFPSRSDIFAAIVQQVMDDEVEFTATYVGKAEPAVARLRMMILDLHRRKWSRFVEDVEVHGLYRIVVADHPALVADYARRMTLLIASLIGEGMERGEFAQGDIVKAAAAVRDAVTTFVHPAMIEAMASDAAAAEARLDDLLDLLIAGLQHGVPHAAE